MLAASLFVLLPAHAVAQSSPQHCLLQTGQARYTGEVEGGQQEQETVSETSELLEGAKTTSDNETQQEQGAASEISKLLGEMESMAMDMPGNGDQLKGTLDGIMAKFDTVVQDTFKKALNETQSKIEQNVRDLENAFNKTMHAMKDASQRNVQLSQCREDERQNVRALET